MRIALLATASLVAVAGLAGCSSSEEPSVGGMTECTKEALHSGAGRCHGPRRRQRLHGRHAGVRGRLGRHGRHPRRSRRPRWWSAGRTDQLHLRGRGPVLDPQGSRHGVQGPRWPGARRHLRAGLRDQL